METNNINWARLKMSLLQDNRNVDNSKHVDEVLECTRLVIGLCGEYSCSRKMALRIARIILRNPQPLVIAPACPDYSHELGKYTFCSLNNGVSLLTKKHYDFLSSLTAVLPEARVMFLLADHESDDLEICRKVGKTKQEFLQAVKESLIETRSYVSSCGWDAMLMTDAIPGLVKNEESISHLISSNPEYSGRLKKETGQRLGMYFKINSLFTDAQILQRTINTAAQYVAMGEFVAGNEYLLCNHTTTNLSWYLQTDAAILHNPVSIY